MLAYIKSALATLTAAAILASAAPVLASGRGHYSYRYPAPRAYGHRHRPVPPRHFVTRHHRHHSGDAVALGIVGGLVGLAILDRVLTPPAPADTFDTGYADGYRRGFERGQSDRYRDGRSRGYEEGYRAGRY